MSENGTGVGETRRPTWPAEARAFRVWPVVERSEMAVAHCGAQRAALR